MFINIFIHSTIENYLNVAHLSSELY